jgi:hypothetical protein
MERSADELGQIMKARRGFLGRTQVQVVEVAKAAGRDISEPSYRQLENGRGWEKASARILSAASVGLEWPPDALARVALGADPSGVGAIEMSASGIDLDELARVDPEMYEQIRSMAALALERANRRNQ